MESQLKDALDLLEKKIEVLEEKLDDITDEVSEIKETLPTTLDEDLSEIKSILIQMT